MTSVKDVKTIALKKIKKIKQEKKVFQGYGRKKNLLKDKLT